jgi:hypothetical protein
MDSVVSLSRLWSFNGLVPNDPRLSDVAEIQVTRFDAKFFFTKAFQTFSKATFTSSFFQGAVAVVESLFLRKKRIEKQILFWALCSNASQLHE